MVGAGSLPNVTLTLNPDQYTLDAGVQTGLSGGSPAGVTGTSDDIIVDNVSLDDGGTVTGYLKFDQFVGGGMETSSDFSISTSGGNTTDFPPTTFDQTNSVATLLGGPNIVEIIRGSDNRRVFLQFTSNLVSGSSGIKNLNANSREDFNGSNPTRIASGSITFGQSVTSTGVYSGTGVTMNGTDFDFDPATAGVGIHPITYTFTDLDGCVKTAMDNMEVSASSM